MSDVQEALGVDPCDPKTLRDKFESIYKDFATEVRDTILEIANNFLGPFIVTFGALMAQLTGASILNLASMLASAVVGGIVGGALALVNLALSLVNGIRIMFKYLAAKTLNSILNSRIEYMRALRADISGFLDLLEALQGLGIQAEDIFFDDIVQALPYVKNAARIVGKESAKVTTTSRLGFSAMNSQAGIDTEQLDTAVTEINKAISELTGGAADPLFAERLSDINERYGIEVDTGITGLEFDVPNPLGVVNYFQDAVDELRKGGNDERVRNYIIEFLSDPGISNFLRDYASTLFMKSRIDSLGERIPVRAYVVSKLGRKAALKLLDETGLDGINNKYEDAAEWRDTARSKLESVFQYLGVSPNKPVVEYPDPGFTTFGANSEAVNSAEAAVLLQDDWMNLIQAESSVVKAFLSPALNKLKGVEAGMETAKNAFEADNAEISDEAAKRKMEWIAELAMAKTLVQSTNEPKIGFSGGQRLSGTEIQNRFKESLEIYDELTSQIISRVLEEVAPGDFQPKQSNSDKVIDIADQYLSSFFLGPVAMFNPAARKDVIAGLQAIRITLSEIERQDFIEISLTDRFIRSVENNPIFNSVVLPAWNAFISSLEDIPILGGIVSGMKKGDLSRLVNAAATSKYAVDQLADATECITKRGEDGDPTLQRQSEAISSTTGITQAKAKAQLEDAQNKISTLKSKRAKLGTIEALLQ